MIASIPPPVGQAMTAAAWFCGPVCVRITGVATCAGKRTSAATAVDAERAAIAPKLLATAAIASSLFTSPNTDTSIGPVLSSGSQNLRKSLALSASTDSRDGVPQRGSPARNSFSRSRDSTPSGDDS